MADLKAVLDKILEATRSGKVPWKEAPPEGSLIALIGDVSAVLIPGFQGPALRVISSEGTVVMTVSVTDETPRSQDEKLEELYALAMSSALGVDETLDKLMKGIDAL